MPRDNDPLGIDGPLLGYLDLMLTFEAAARAGDETAALQAWLLAEESADDFEEAYDRFHYR